MVAQVAYNLDPKYPVHDLEDYLRVVEDKSQNFHPEDILSDSTLNFEPSKTLPKRLNLGSTYWGKIKLVVKDSLKGWTLHFEDRHIGLPAWSKSNGKVDVYGFVNGKQILHKKTGVEYPKKVRDSDSHWALNQISLQDLPLDVPVELVIKVQGNQMGYPPYFNLSARSPDQRHYHQLFQFQNAFNIFFFGVSFIVLLYHVLQYVYLRERVYLWFSIWLLFVTFTLAMTVGFFIGSLTMYRYALWILLANGVFYSFWFFGRSFVQSKLKYPKLDKVIITLPVLLIIEIVLVAIYSVVFNPQTRFTGLGYHYLILNIYTFASLILSVVLVLKKDLFAKYFGVGGLVGNFFLILGVFWGMGKLKEFGLNFDPFSMGMFLQIIIFSFGIAYRRQVLNNQNQKQQLKAKENALEIERIKDLNQIKTRFYANISHEFRTPLTLINGPLEMAKTKSNHNSEITINQKGFETILKNTHRLQNLIDQLLEISKMESGAVNLLLRKGGVISFLKTLVNSFESMADRENVALNSVFPEELDRAFYDRDKLEKIVTNILSNAIKYTSNKGSVTLSVIHDNQYLTIECADTGEGMDNHELKKIFERFYRVETSEKEGSGIGLALTKEIVELHNGKISVSSLKNKGTTFKVRLPITLGGLPDNVVFENAEQVDYSDTTYQDVLLNRETNKVQPTSKNSQLPIILVVEDNNELAEYISSILKPNYKVLSADNGLKGERMAFEHIPDILITDVMMPKKDGLQLSNSLKNNPKTSHIPIIMLTAKAGNESKIAGLSQGVDAYLTKPFKHDELLIRIENLLENKHRLYQHFMSLETVVLNDIDVKSIDDKFIQDVIAEIKKNIDNDRLSVDDLAKAVGFSRSQLHRKLKALIDKSANQLIVEIRLNEAKRLLETKSSTVSEAAYAVGYLNLSYFTKSFKEKFGVLPSRI
ncbi:MAG: ATP-binding protein [Psychroserpens sp.]|uniref:ATP-binding protein n=1 Tax=Psychroserpens sp. TaxID=2020870 RepID=UPI003C725A7A